MLACDKHDYIEIACMYHFKVVLKLKAGGEITGHALDTVLNSNREECIQIINHNQLPELIILSEVSTMHSVTKNLHFDCVKFD